MSFLPNLFDEGLPDLDCFFVSVNRHDRDRIELQCGFDGLVQSNQETFSYDVDFVLFVPKTLGLLESGERNELREEFQSYVRLHTHVTDPKSDTSFLRVKDRLENLKEKLSLESLRVFAIEFEGYLKAQSKRMRRQIQALHNPGTVSTELIISEIQAAHRLVNDFRGILKGRHVLGVTAVELTKDGVDHNLVLLNEYVSHLYVQYLGVLHFAARLQSGAEGILEQLQKSSIEEAELRQSCSLLVEQRHGPHSSLDEDLYLRRISLLKKYFQKTLFVEVKGQELQHRMFIPAYGISAALAASFAIIVQLYQARTLAERVGINSIALITVGVIAYVAKDIFKNFFRGYFLENSSRWFPDYEKTLFIDRKGKKEKLGEIAEYVRTFDSAKMPEDLRKARYSNPGGEMEEYLHEDILHFKKRVTLNLPMLDTTKEFPWGLREVVRYKFDRLRTSMEDPFKSMHMISKSGSSSTRQGHRVYHIYLAAWVTRTNRFKKHEGKPEFKSYRISLDKTGVLGVESTKWDEKFGVPSIPD